ncbi:MAG: hypothetical protein RJA44_568 [Pseudomonadota bacterium]
MKRRHLLIGGLTGAGALLLGWGDESPVAARLGPRQGLAAQPGTTTLNGWLRIAADGSVHLGMPRAELGQGVHTGLAMLVAEQLGVDLAQIHLEQVGPEPIYAHTGLPAELQLHASSPAEPGLTQRLRLWFSAPPRRRQAPLLQITAGACSVAEAWDYLPLVAATARARLVGAAALRWHLAPEDLMVAQGVVRQPVLGLKAHFGELVQQAVRAPQAPVRLLPRSEWSLLGSTPPRLDLPAKVRGTARYGLDVRPDGLLHAVVRLAPQPQARLGKVDLEALRGRPGVEQVLELPALAGAPPGLVVVARTTWHALQALRTAQIDWQLPESGTTAPRDSAAALAALAEAAQQACGGSTGRLVYQLGGAGGTEIGTATDRSASRSIEASYQWPMLPHLAPEPPNCTALLREHRLSLWLPTQVPDYARLTAARVAGVPSAQVTLHLSEIGGSFGRRLEVDVIAQATHVARQLQGRPVQLLWPHEEDQRHDRCSPPAAATLRATLGADGLPLQLQWGQAGSLIGPEYQRRACAGLDLAAPLQDAEAPPEPLPYRIAQQQLRQVDLPAALPPGFRRGGSELARAFFAESFINELAHAAGRDALDYRLALLEGQPLHRAVLDRLAEATDWRKPAPAGRARGLALHACRGSVVAVVAEVASQPRSTRLRVTRLWCAVDAGLAIHPDAVRQQLEGGLIDALATALHGGVEFRDGQLQPDTGSALLGLAETPQIQCLLLDSERAPCGVGDIALPPLAPALAAAIHALTGQRLRRLPLRPA